MSTDINNAEAILFLNLLGAAIKATPKVSNHWIPYILATVGILVSIGTDGVSVKNALNGAILGMSAVGTHQLLRQGRDLLKGKVAEKPEA